MVSTKNIYSLPLNKEDIKFAVSDVRAHFGHMKYAIDFPIPEGTKIFAAKSGTVITVKQDSKEGGYQKKYENPKYLNFVSIMHASGEISEYCHLKYNGARIKVGDKVNAKQLIGLSGNTGYSTESHLHFHVAKLNKSKIGWKTLKIKFNEKIKIIRIEK